MSVRKKLSLLCLAPALVLLGCNHTPVENLEKSFTYKVKKDTGDGEPIKIDFLWVIDDSTSMCQEQVSLGRSFRQFQDTIAQAFDVDVRIAATSVNAECEPGTTTAAGVFNTKPYRTASIDCAASTRLECEVEQSCGNLDPEFGSTTTNGTWTCGTQVQQLPECVVNPNGSINTQCKRACATNEECVAVFGAGYVCSTRDGETGCAPVPPTADCPDTLPPVITNDNLDLFRCIASVGLAPGRPCYRYEQQFKSALLALDKNGRNAEQAKDFLRDDAYLVVIFVSDEEDCSTIDGVRLPETNYDNCGLLKTSDEGGPLLPVAHVVNRLKAMKRDPGRVIVAAIAGDSTADDPADVALERQSYLESKGHPRSCHRASYICASRNGVADFGSRFRELAESFGPNGVFTNICDDEGVGPALEQVAQTIVAVINKICLPRPILDNLVVKRIRNGVATELVEGEGPGTYRKIGFSEDCVANGQVMPAITFGDPPIPGEEIEITYEGDPQFD